MCFFFNSFIFERKRFECFNFYLVIVWTEDDKLKSVNDILSQEGARWGFFFSEKIDFLQFYVVCWFGVKAVEWFFYPMFALRFWLLQIHHKISVLLFFIMCKSPQFLVWESLLLNAVSSFIVHHLLKVRWVLGAWTGDNPSFLDSFEDCVMFSGTHCLVKSVAHQMLIKFDSWVLNSFSAAFLEAGTFNSDVSLYSNLIRFLKHPFTGLLILALWVGIFIFEVCTHIYLS